MRKWVRPSLIVTHFHPADDRSRELQQQFEVLSGHLFSQSQPPRTLSIMQQKQYPMSFFSTYEGNPLKDNWTDYRITIFFDHVSYKVHFYFSQLKNPTWLLKELFICGIFIARSCPFLIASFYRWLVAAAGPRRVKGSDLTSSVSPSLACKIVSS